jgi:hypothetical protein
MNFLGLSRELPNAIDALSISSRDIPVCPELTPNGRLPTEQEASRWV